MDEDRRHVTLSKADRVTPAGRELIALLTELSADGQVTREEMERLRVVRSRSGGRLSRVSLPLRSRGHDFGGR
jgi:hypothetical protein